VREFAPASSVGEYFTFPLSVAVFFLFPFVDGFGHGALEPKTLASTFKTCTAVSSRGRDLVVSNQTMMEFSLSSVGQASLQTTIFMLDTSFSLKTRS
jgi:hypothetical protein